MKGIGNEKTFKVTKRKVGARGIRSKVVPSGAPKLNTKSTSPVRDSKADNSNFNQFKGVLG